MISVVIPLYNKVDTIVRALQSVASQTFTDYELIVVDDGSTDGGTEVVLQWSKTHGQSLRLLRQENRGVAAARNHGVREARGTWVALLDADDEWRPDFLSAVARLIQQYPTSVLCATSYLRKTTEEPAQRATLRGLPFESDEGSLDDYFSVSLQSEPPVCSSAVALRREVLLSVGGFPEGITQGEDLLTWARMALQGPFAYSRYALATLHVEHPATSLRPKRAPSEPDTVGNELATMARNHPDRESLRLYVALWHKMRANMFLRLPHSRRKCCHELQLVRLWNPSLTLPSYRILCLLPYRLRMSIMKWAQKL
ncbi:MAG: glycosyltransferase family 2 protein [Bacteroidales bacterium]|nr:glycosyltransferase family 2 protein [Bacteroidales bacterium]